MIRYNLVHRNMTPPAPIMHPRLTLAGLEEHPLRQRLNNEFHARPPVPLVGAMLVSHLVFKHSATTAQAERDNLAKLCQGQVCNSIDSSDSHMMLETGAFRMRWELHTEFSSYTFFRPLKAGEPLAPDATAFAAVALAPWPMAVDEAPLATAPSPMAPAVIGLSAGAAILATRLTAPPASMDGSDSAAVRAIVLGFCTIVVRVGTKPSASDTARFAAFWSSE